MCILYLLGFLYWFVLNSISDKGNKGVYCVDGCYG